MLQHDLDPSGTAPAHRYPVSGAGLGLRREYLDAILEADAPDVDFLEVAPENWIGVGGPTGRKLRALLERFPFVCHGLSLNLGGPAPIDIAFVRQVREFLDEIGARCFTEHLSACADDGQLYDLMPIPFTGEAVRHVAERIAQVQDILGRRIAIENSSYYATLPGSDMREIDFINAVIAEADCGLHLDVNNVYVNSVNHGYDSAEFLSALPGDRIFYAHVAGHDVRAEDLLIDTHGAPVCDPVWSLLERAYAAFGIFPTLLERDSNGPPFVELIDEVTRIRQIQARASPRMSTDTPAHV